MIGSYLLYVIGGLFAVLGLSGGGGSGSSSGPSGPTIASGSIAPLGESPAEEDPPAEDDTPSDDDSTPSVVVEPPAPSAPVTTPDLPSSDYDIGWAGLTPEEQLIVELVNRARLDPLAEVDRLDEGLASGISSSPVQALAVAHELSDAARGHSEDMDNRDFFSHTSPDGDGPGARAIEAGHGTGFVGENIGWVGSTFAPNPQARAEYHHEGLWESDGHQRNMMDDRWSEIGLGYDYGDYRGYDHSTFTTELFSDRGDVYLTGVVIEDQDGDDFYDIGEGQGDVRVTAFNGDDAFATATWDAGGYSLALPPGTYRVVFEGGDLDAPYETEVTIGNENVKLDVIEDGGTVLASVNAGTPLPGIPVVEETLSAIPEEETDDLLELV